MRLRAQRYKSEEIDKLRKEYAGVLREAAQMSINHEGDVEAWNVRLSDLVERAHHIGVTLPDLLSE